MKRLVTITRDDLAFLLAKRRLNYDETFYWAGKEVPERMQIMAEECSHTWIEEHNKPETRICIDCHLAYPKFHGQVWDHITGRFEQVEDFLERVKK